MERDLSRGARLGLLAALAVVLGTIALAPRPASATSASGPAGGTAPGAPLALVPVHGPAPIAATVTAGSRRWGQAVLVNMSPDLRLTVAVQGGGTAGAWFAPVPAVVELAPGQRQAVAFGIAPPDDQHGHLPGALVARVVGARAVAGGDAVVVRVARVTLAVDLNVVPRVPLTAAHRSAVTAVGAADPEAIAPVSSAPGRHADLLMMTLVVVALAAAAAGSIVWPRVRAARAHGGVVALDISMLNDALSRRTSTAAQSRRGDAPTGQQRSVPAISSRRRS